MHARTHVKIRIYAWIYVHVANDPPSVGFWVIDGMGPGLSLRPNPNFRHAVWIIVRSTG